MQDIMDLKSCSHFSSMKGYNGMRQKVKLLHIILWVFFCISFSNSASINAPAPTTHSNIDMIEIGKVDFLLSANTLSTGDYMATFTITLAKMNKYIINNYDAFFGWRGIDIIIQTQTEGLGTYSAGINAKTATSIRVGSYVTKLTSLKLLTGNYLLVHQDLVTSGMIVGTQFLSTTPCAGVPSTGGGPNCIYPFPYSMQATGLQRIVSIRHLTMYRDDDLIKIVKVEFAVQPASPNVNVQLYFGQGGSITEFIINLVLIQNKFVSKTVKRSLQFENWPYIQPYSTVPLLTKVYSLTSNGFDYNLFVGLKSLKSTNSEFHYTVSADSTNKVTSLTYLIGSLPQFRAFIFYGYQCKSTTFYFSDATQVCEICPDYCVSCQLNILNKIQCLQCDVNFVLSPDKITCICGITKIATVCDNFITLGLSDCTNAVRNGTIVQCNFCSATNFQTVQNNQCVCKLGYNDFDGDGTCQETCGDGMIFLHQCDDGNILSGDGCSSSCILEAGFTCDTNQPTYCTTQMSLFYKIAYVERIEGENKGRIKLNLMNSLASLPFDFITDQFRPPTTYVRLFLVLSQSPLKQMQIMDTNLLDLTSDKEMILQFSYSFTVETFTARIAIDYSKTRYASHLQELKSDISGINNPLIYSDKLATYSTISIVLCVGTAFSLVGMFVGVCSPKYIGLESLLTLQLIFYSQILIADPSKWPVGFLYLKYLKFSSGYNDILKLSEYVPQTIDANKMSHLTMKKTIIQNFNTNFVILMISFIVFMVFFFLKYIKESKFIEQEEIRKQQALHGQDDTLVKFDQKEKIEIMKSICLLRKIGEKVFWIVNHFCVWMLLPIMASIAAQIVIKSELVEIVNSSIFPTKIITFGSIIALLSVFVIFTICMNNFMNMFLGQQTMKKIIYKPEEQIYKRLIVVYLMVIGFLVFFMNDVAIFNFPISIFVLFLQIIYTISLVIIHPYKQSLRIHSITLLVNQCVYTVFLAFINLINFVNEMDETLIMILGYFITGCCGFLMVLTGIRLYYELRYGEALEKEIQQERQREEELQKKLQEQKLERMKKKLQRNAMKKQTQKEIERQGNQFLYQNQAKQDEAMEVIDWLQKCNWQKQDKQKYFFSKFSQKTMNWLKKHNIAEYQRLMQIKKGDLSTRRQRTEMKKSDEDYIKLTNGLRNEGEKHIEILQKKLLNHQKRIQIDMNYSMEVMKNELNRFVSKDFTLTD